MRLPLFLTLALSLVACGGSSTGNPGEPALGVEGALLVPLPQGNGSLSAPLFPDATVFQTFQNPAAYPALSEAERTALIDESVYTFEALLPLCADKDATIILPSEGVTLSAEQIAVNYDAVARCAYEDYGAKPYWVPQQVLDVDICARKLGAGYRLPTEADVASIPESDLEALQQILTSLQGSGTFPNGFYYSLDAYVLAADGTLRLGNLAPGAPHIEPLPVSGDAMNELYIGDGRPIGLRCLSISANE